MKLSDLIRVVCRLGYAEHAFINAHLDRTHPGQKFVPLSAYIDIPPAPARQELAQLLRAQSPAALCMLLTVWRLGRRDFAADADFLEEYLETADRCKNVTEVIDYLLRKQLVAFLESALELLAEEGIDVDDLLD